MEENWKKAYEPVYTRTQTVSGPFVVAHEMPEAFALASRHRVSDEQWAVSPAPVFVGLREITIPIVEVELFFAEEYRGEVGSLLPHFRHLGRAYDYTSYYQQKRDRGLLVIYLEKEWNTTDVNVLEAMVKRQLIVDWRLIGWNDLGAPQPYLRSRKAYQEYSDEPL